MEKRGRKPKFQCFTCREVFRRVDGHVRSKTFYCLACYEKAFPDKGPAPVCPECGGTFEYFTWHGSAEKTTVHCFCGPRGEKGWRALDFFDELTIKIQAAPIVGV